MNSNIQRVLIISSGIAVYDYSNENETLEISDDQLLSGFLGAFQSFSNDMGTEINAVKFKQVTIYYRIIKCEDLKSQNVSLVFIAKQSADENDIRIRTEYACQIFVHKYSQLLKHKIIDSTLFQGFNSEIKIILISDRNQIETLLPKSFLQVLIKELQNVVPMKQLEKLLKKYAIVYDQETKTFIDPGDLSTDQVNEIVKQLENATKMLFGKILWDNAFANASKSITP